MAALIKPKEVSVADVDGVEHAFTISRFPSVAGREIVTQYVPSALPKLGDYKRNEEIMLMAMCYVGVKPAKGEMILLTNQTLVDNHTHDYECLMRLEAALLGYNTTFFGREKTSALFASFGETLTAWITKTLTALSDQSSPTGKRRSKN